jgi:hypothetical protein
MQVMKNQNNRIVALIILLFQMTFSGCLTTVTEEKRPGINGETVYHLYGRTVGYVYKEDYYLPIYKIMINKDTLDLNEEFYLTIVYPYKKECKVVIEEPYSDTIMSNGPEDSFAFFPKEKGVYEFSGTMSYDSSVVPFSYKFFVR